MHKYDLTCKDCHTKLGEATFEKEPDPQMLPALLTKQRCKGCAEKAAAETKESA